MGDSTEMMMMSMMMMGSVCCACSMLSFGGAALQYFTCMIDGLPCKDKKGDGKKLRITHIPKAYSGNATGSAARWTEHVEYSDEKCLQSDGTLGDCGDGAGLFELTSDGHLVSDAGCLVSDSGIDIGRCWGQPDDPCTVSLQSTVDNSCTKWMWDSKKQLQVKDYSGPAVSDLEIPKGFLTGDLHQPATGDVYGKDVGMYIGDIGYRWKFE